MKKILSITILIALTYHSYGQELGLSTMNNLWQGNLNNPAVVSNHKFILSLPSFGINASTGRFNYNKITSKNQSGEIVLDADKIISTSSENNRIGSDQSIETLAIAFGNDKWQFHIAHRMRNQIQANLPKHLLQVALEGNEQFIGQTINIAPTASQLLFSETALGFNWKFDKLSLGLRAKSLTGIATVQTQNNIINLSTSEKHHLNISTDYIINSGGAIQFVQTGDNIDDGLDVTTPDEISDVDFTSNNKGFAIDLGATYQINDKWAVSGSIIDLGRIKWKENVTNQTTKGSYEYKGLDIADIIEDEDVNFDIIQDSIINALDFQETDNSFKTRLTARTFWTVQYQVSPKINVGGIFNTTHYKGNLVPTFGVNGGLQLGNIFHLGSILSYSTNRNLALGGNMVLTLGPVQIFSAFDNLLVLNSVANTNYVHARAGINFVFGRKDKNKIEQIEENKEAIE